jgi:predicted nucleic acid-binding protein
MRFLVDTNIFSEPTKPRPDARVEQWIADHGADFYTSSLVIAELLNGLEKLADGERKRHLAPRLERVGHAHMSSGDWWAARLALEAERG